MKKHCFFLVPLFLLANVLIAQNSQVSMSGIITDKISGEVLIGTNLLVYQDSILTDSDSYRRGSSTNRYGFYTIMNLEVGKYFLVVRNIGYKTLVKEINITITKGKIDYNIELVPEEIELDEVVVTSEIVNNVNISTIQLAPKLIQMLPSISGELEIFKSLQLLPGVQVASEISNGLYIRGGSPDQTLTLVDGMVLYNPSHLGNFTSTFNSNAVQDIKLIKGAYPAEYGGRLSSVLDIKLISGTKEKTKSKIGVGTINSFISVEGPLSDNSTFLFSGRSMYYDAILNSLNKSSNIPRYNYFDVNSKLTYNLSDNNALSFSLVYSKDNLYDTKSNNNFNYDINWQNGAFSLNWLRILDKSTFTNTTLSFVNYRFETNISDNAESVASSNYYANSKLTDILLKNNAEIRWDSENVIKGGMDLTFHVYDVLFSNVYSYAVEQSLRTSEDYIEIAVFLQNESNFSEILKMNMGARVNYFVGQDNFQLEPRVSFSYSPTYYLTFKTAVAKTFQFLHLLTRNDKSLPTDLWYPSNEYMKPSESWQYVLGIESNIDNNNYLLTLEGYYRDMKHLYEFKNDASFDAHENLGEQITEGSGEAYGIELFMNKRTGAFQGWIGYTLSWTNRIFDEINGGNVFYPRYDKRHDISVALTYEAIKNLTIGVSWGYSIGERITMPTGQYVFQDVAFDDNLNVNLNSAGRNGYVLPAYHKLDFNLTYRFNWNKTTLETYLNIYNVYNNYNVFSYYIAYNDNSLTPVINQITLFPFLPTVGITINF